MSEVSVLVPSYDHAPFVERTLRSIYAQTFPVKKLIVIDDGSKDESVGVIRSVLKDCPFEFEFIERENRGLCATLNEGLSKTDGEYFAYLGSDDVWAPNFLAEQIALLESRSDCVLAFSHAFVIDDDDNIFDRTDNWTDFADGNMLPNLLSGEIFSSPGVVYRRSTLEKYGWNEDAALEDYELYLSLCTEGPFARNEKLLCAWRRHGQNTSDDVLRMLAEQLNAQERMAGRIGLDEDALREMQTVLRFNTVSELVRSGKKKEAWQVFRENARGSDSFYRTIKTLSQLLIPYDFFLWNRMRKRRRSMLKYGKLRF